MSIMKYARWAAFAAALSMPVAALAQEQPAPAQQQQVPSQQGTQGQQQPQQPTEAQPENAQGTQGNTATQGTQAQEAPNATVSKSEIDTLAYLQQVNKDEIDAGKLAQKQSKTDAIKDYGKTLVTDHQNLNDDIQNFAKQNNIKLPKEKKLPAEDQSQLKQLTQQQKTMKKQKGTAFDQMFLQNMVTDHQQVLARVDAMASQTQNGQLQTLLKDKVKPVLQAHIDRANELMKNNAQAMR